MGIFLVSLVSAIIVEDGESINITAGKSINITLPEEYDYYSIIGNSTLINITTNSLNVTITTNKYTKSDSFELIFFNSEKEVIYKSGGSRTKYVDRNITVEKEVEKIIGNETDEHGCLLMAGYTWCEPKQRCIRTWEEECIAEDVKKPIKEKIILGIIIGLLVIVILILIKIINKKVKGNKLELK